MIYRVFKIVATCAIALSVCGPMIAVGQESLSPAQDLSSLSLEVLTHIDVASVFRKPQELFKTPAAVFIISREDIKASGANSLPELFRIVPGMQVAQIDANTWAVSARGFNSRYADKMLVLIDGRSMYSEIYSGVSWDHTDVLLEDIDRIEVIRGPGGTLWGANAVNGIINIITRSANQTRGTKAVAIAGTSGNGGTILHGGELGRRFAYKGFVKFLRRNALIDDHGISTHDTGDSIRIGARGDLQATGKDLVSFHGDIFRAAESQRIAAHDLSATDNYALDAISTLGGYGSARWEHRFAGSDLALQAYYTDEYRVEFIGTLREHNLDFDFEHHLPSFLHNDVVWGLGYRLNTDHILSSPAAFTSDHHLDALYSLFFQDDYVSIRNKLVLTGGFKLQRNSYTGFEFQPDVRVLWTPDTHHSLWASAAKAVRTPSVQDRDLHIFEPVQPENGLPAEVLAMGNSNFQAEILVAYEAGYRQSLGQKASLDVAAFVNKYTNLRDQAMPAPYVTSSPSPTLIIPYVYNNDLDAKTHGVEIAAAWTPAHSFHIRASYAWVTGSIYTFNTGAASTTGDGWSTPTNTVSIRPTWSFGRHWALNSYLYSVSRLERVGTGGIAPVKAFVRLDQHVSFNFFEAFTLAAGVNNILQSRHPEFDPTDGFTVRSQIPRSAFLKAVWIF